MSVVCFSGDCNFFKSLQGEKASFFLGGSVTKTCEIDGITQAGIPGNIHLTPTLDSEFLVTGQVFSMPKIAETPKGVPTPALITRAVHNLLPFNEIKILDLGLTNKPQIDKEFFVKFSIKTSERIDKGAEIDVGSVFNKGIVFGKSVELRSKYIILGESTPAGTTTAAALSKAIGYNTDHAFSSSFKDSPIDIKHRVIEESLKGLEGKPLIDKIAKTADNMLIFTAGFLVGISERCKVVLGGGTQMGAALLLADSMSRYFKLSLKNENIALATTKWVYTDIYSDIKKLLSQLSFTVNAFYADFDFSLSNSPVLSLYDQGEGKEGVGAGSALVYALLNNISKKSITKEVEKFLQ